MISKPAVNTVFSKMDCVAHPLVNLYCEDDMAKQIIRNLLIKINEERKDFDKLVNIVKSGAKNNVRDDYERHKRNFNQFQPKKEYCCVFDGDVFLEDEYDKYKVDPFVFFLYPYNHPERMLISSYLKENPNRQLSSFFEYGDMHQGFAKMVELGLAADESDAYSKCWMCFSQSEDYNTLFSQFKTFILNTVEHFTELAD